MRFEKIAIWSTDVEDQPGATTGLFKVMGDAKVDLSFVVARRQAENPGKGVIFVSPIKGAKAEQAAQRAGFSKRHDVVGVRVEGPNKAGIGFQLTQALAGANLNLRALSAQVIGKTFSAVFAFDSDSDANEGLAVLKKVKLK